MFTSVRALRVAVLFSLALWLPACSFFYGATDYYREGRYLYKKGRMSEAIMNYEWAVQLGEVEFGRQHPDTARLINNLALLYKIEGRYDEAEDLYKRSLDIREQVYGPTHSSVAVSHYNLAVLYHAQGREEEAEARFKKSLNIAEYAAEPNYRVIVTFLENYADFLRETGRETDADEVEARVELIKGSRSP